MSLTGVPNHGAVPRLGSFPKTLYEDLLTRQLQTLAAALPSLVYGSSHLQVSNDQPGSYLIASV